MYGFAEAEELLFESATVLWIPVRKKLKSEFSGVK